MKKNIENFNCEKKIELFPKNVNNIKSIKKIKEKKFDIIFLDPPYKEKNIILLLNEIKDMNILFEKGIIILHRHKKSNDNFNNKFKILRKENYGKSKIVFGNFI